MIGKLYASLKRTKEGAYKEKVLQLSFILWPRSTNGSSGLMNKCWMQWTMFILDVNEAARKHGVPPTTLKDRIF